MSVTSRGQMRQWLLLLSLLVVASFATDTRAEASSAAAQEAEAREQAREAFARGRDAYMELRFVEAIGHFERANAILPNPRLFLFIGQSYANLEDFDRAIAAYERFADTSPEAAAEIADELSLLRIQALVSALLEASAGVDDAVLRSRGSQPPPRSSRRFELGVSMRDVPVQIRTVPSGASVYLDDRELGPIGTTPLETRLFTGRHLLIVERENYEPLRQIVQVATLAPGESIPVFRFEMRRQEVPVRVSVTPSTATLTWIAEGGSRRSLGVGNYEGELMAGPGTFIVQQGANDRRVEVVLRPNADGTPVQIEVSLDERTATTQARMGLGTLRLVTSLEGAEVLVNGRPIGTGPGAFERELSPGAHVVQVRREGFVSWSQTVRITADEVSEVVPPAELARVRGPLVWPAYLLMPAGAGLAGYGAYAWVSAEDGEDTAGLVMLGAGCAMVAAGLTWALVGSSMRRARVRSAEAPGDTRWVFAPTPFGASLQFQGHF